MNSNTKKMAVTAVFLALGTALSFVKIWNMPMGGSVTLLSMLPIALVSITYGLKWGFTCSFLYSLIQLGFGISIDGVLGWGLTPVVLIACFVFDYLLAFTAIGLAGLFRKKGVVGICAGIFIALAIRFASHWVSGAFLFAEWMPEQWSSPYLYSIVYNGAYMLPEIIFTMIGAVLLFKSPIIKKLIDDDSVSV
ncbi:MAG: energy-coupled thiamine transporter ThiT [Clostridia bacterium]